MASPAPAGCDSGTREALLIHMVKMLPCPRHTAQADLCSAALGPKAAGPLHICRTQSLSMTPVKGKSCLVPAKPLRLLPDAVKASCTMFNPSNLMGTEFPSHLPEKMTSQRSQQGLTLYKVVTQQGGLVPSTK